MDERRPLPSAELFDKVVVVPASDQKRRLDGDEAKVRSTVDSRLETVGPLFGSGPNVDSCASAGRCYSIIWSARTNMGWASFECRGLGFRITRM